MYLSHYSTPFNEKASLSVSKLNGDKRVNTNEWSGKKERVAVGHPNKRNYGHPNLRIPFNNFQKDIFGWLKQLNLHKKLTARFQN